MKPFVVNRYGRIVFPYNFIPELDFSVFETLEQFAAVIRRDFEDKAPTEADIVDPAGRAAPMAGATSSCATSRSISSGSIATPSPCTTSGPPGGATCRASATTSSCPWFAVGGRRAGRRHRGRLSRPGPDLGRGHRGQDLPHAARRLPPQEGRGGGAARPSSPRSARCSASPQDPHLSSPRLQSRLPRLRLRRHHRVRAPGARAGGADAPGHGAPQPVPVGSARKIRLIEVGQLHDDDFVVVYHPRNDDVLQLHPAGDAAAAQPAARTRPRCSRGAR